MNLDELQSVQARERQSSDLQHLRSSFYADVGEFIAELQNERARAVERADDPFSSSEVRHLTDDIETAESTVEAIYERRVGKVVKKASIAAAGMPVEDDGLTAEEEQLFESLVSLIEENREAVLSVLDGDAPNVSCTITDETEELAPTSASRSTPEPSTESPPDLDAAELMGGASDTAESTEPTAEDEPDAAPVEVPPERPPPDAASPSPETTEESSETAREKPETDGDSDSGDVPGVPRTVVRITREIGEMVGADNRDYELGTEDVVTLPEPNANVLIEKNAAERID